MNTDLTRRSAPFQVGTELQAHGCWVIAAVADRAKMKHACEVEQFFGVRAGERLLMHRSFVSLLLSVMTTVVPSVLQAGLRPLAPSCQVTEISLGYCQK